MPLSSDRSIDAQSARIALTLDKTRVMHLCLTSAIICFASQRGLPTEHCCTKVNCCQVEAADVADVPVLVVNTSASSLCSFLPLSVRAMHHVCAACAGLPSLLSRAMYRFVCDHRSTDARNTEMPMPEMRGMPNCRPQPPLHTADQGAAACIPPNTASRAASSSAIGASTHRGARHSALVPQTTAHHRTAHHCTSIATLRLTVGRRRFLSLSLPLLWLHTAVQQRRCPQRRWRTRLQT